ncbi:MAG: hypothetical protein H6870_06245 [Methylobacteriaceae bacterium]|nr:hypothetical protein [Methylobacteriaceae bacterium]
MGSMGEARRLIYRLHLVKRAKLQGARVADGPFEQTDASSAVREAAAMALA